MQASAIYFEQLADILANDNQPMALRMRELRRVLQYLATDATMGAPVQFPDLFARMGFLNRTYKVPREIQLTLGALRYKSRKNADLVGVSPAIFNGYAFAVGALISQLHGEALPAFVQALREGAEMDLPPQREVSEFYPYLTGEVWEKTDRHLVIRTPEMEELVVPIHPEDLSVAERLNSYQETLSLLLLQDKVALLDVRRDEADKCYPRHIVYEPDYLIDVSALAECFQVIGGKAIGAWQLFYLGRYRERNISIPMHLGNVANMLLDELMFASRDEFPPPASLFKASFAMFPFEYTLLFNNDQALREFYGKVQQHYHNLTRVINKDLSSSFLQVNRDEAILEPAFLSEKLGIQGRLDVLDYKRNKETATVKSAKIIELKSGKLPWPQDDPIRVSENHAAQARLYAMLIHYLTGLPMGKINSYICYSSGSIAGQNVREVSVFKQFSQQMLNVRNQIVHTERTIASSIADTDIEQIYLQFTIPHIGLDPAKKIPEFFREKFSRFRDKLTRLDPVEKSWYFATNRFLAQEQFLAKVGDGRIHKGLSALWNKDDTGENDDLEIINNLLVVNNQLSHIEQPEIEFHRQGHQDTDIFNFREGDICVLYPQDKPGQLATEGQVFKCMILAPIDAKGKLRVGFRYKQKDQVSKNVFWPGRRWALEHDMIDYPFNKMYEGVWNFLATDREVRDRILGREMPRQADFEVVPRISEGEIENPDSRAEMNTLLARALAAQDYFLLIGPPGTGKTSKMLKHLVRALHSETRQNILLLAYTNRAVDEICDAVNDAFLSFGGSRETDEEINFIRIGSRLSSDEKYHPNLLDSVGRTAGSRAELAEAIDRHRVFVSTVASISGKTHLFDLKKFDTVIIDEASQILEPQLVGILPYMTRFILIGDQKQLPAVSLQMRVHGERFHERLRPFGYRDLRESYFERMLRLAWQMDWEHAWGQLSHQGRMHPEVALFPNQCFYGRELKIAGLPHQLETLPDVPPGADGLDKYLAAQRLIFIPSKRCDSPSMKVNEHEAKAIAELVPRLKARLGEEYHPEKSVGIITPYRNQIANIRKALQTAGFADWQRISIDTVERYQGSQRDIIIYSFSLNSIAQIDFLAQSTTLDEKSGQWVDRKLNVALTRARKQIILLGNPFLLNTNRLYFKLVEFIRMRGGFIADGTDGVIRGKVYYMPDFVSQAPPEEVLALDNDTQAFFDAKVVDVLKQDPRTVNFPVEILGESHDFNRNIGIEYGRADFDQSLLLGYSAADRVRLYAYYNMRSHLLAQFALFEHLAPQMHTKISQYDGKLTLLDWGCGPATAAFSLNMWLKMQENIPQVNYLGIDISVEMQRLAAAFLADDLFPDEMKYSFTEDLEELDMLADVFETPQLVVLNFSYFFGNVKADQARKIADKISAIRERFPMNAYWILFQNSAYEKRNFSYRAFRRYLPDFSEEMSRVTQLAYRTRANQESPASQQVYQEILALR